MAANKRGKRLEPQYSGAADHRPSGSAGCAICTQQKSENDKSETLPPCSQCQGTGISRQTSLIPVADHNTVPRLPDVVVLDSDDEENILHLSKRTWHSIHPLATADDATVQSGKRNETVLVATLQSQGSGRTPKTGKNGSRSKTKTATIGHARRRNDHGKPVRIPAGASAAMSFDLRTNPGAWGSLKFETRSIQFFHEKTLPILIHMDPEGAGFWSILLPQIVLDDLAVKHMMLAFSLGHETTLQLSNAQSVKADSLKYVAKALKSLTKINKRSMPHILLCACLCFIGMTVLVHRDVMGAFAHVRSGYRILEERTLELENGAQLNSLDLTIKTYITPIFQSLAAVLGSLVQGTSQDSLDAAIPRLPEGDLSDDEASEKVRELAEWAHSIYEDTAYSVYIATLAHTWNDWLLATLPRMRDFDTKRYLQIQLLQIHCDSGQMHRRILLDQMAWDLCVDIHRKQLATCKDITEHNLTYEDDEDFLAAPGVAFTLWIIAAQCREPSIRHQAQDLLQSHLIHCNQRSAPAVSIARFFTAMEEDNGTPIHTCADILPEYRIRFKPCNYYDPDLVSISFNWGPSDLISIPVLQIVADPLGAAAFVKAHVLGKQ